MMVGATARVVRRLVLVVPHTTMHSMHVSIRMLTLRITHNQIAVVLPEAFTNQRRLASIREGDDQPAGGQLSEH